MDKLFPFFRRQENLGNTSEMIPPRLIDTHPELIDAKNLKDYSDWASTVGGRGLLDKIVNNIRYIDSDDTEKSLVWMSERIDECVGSSDYLLLYDHQGHSGDWVTNQLKIKSPVARLSVWLGEGAVEAKRLKGKFEKIVYVDDSANSGTQAMDMIKIFLRDSGLGSKRLYLFFMGITDYGKTTLRQGLHPELIEARYRIPTFDQIFSNSELTGLEHIFKEWRGHSPTTVLTFFNHSISDNFLPPIIRTRAKMIEVGKALQPLYLIDNVNRFNRPYRHRQ